MKYQGTFTTVAGTSPGGSGTLASGIVGNLQGGYTAIFTGSLAPTGKKRGSIGTIDYQCDATTGNCPGYLDWRTLFFPSGVGSFTIPWWGWVYHAGSDGDWENAISGNSGDISGD